MDDNNYSNESWLISPEELKERFESYIDIDSIAKNSLFGKSGTWENGFWYYFDSELMNKFSIFCNGFAEGAITILAMEDFNQEEEKQEQERRMEKQIAEEDTENIFTVIDIKDYQDIYKN